MQNAQVVTEQQGIQCGWDRNEGGVGEELQNVIRYNIMKDFKQQGKSTEIKTSNFGFSLRKMGDH